METGISGRVAFVTGASKGLGRATALSLAAEGCKVVVVARGSQGVNETVEVIRAAGGDAFGIVCDLSLPEQIRAAVAAAREHFGPIDIAVFNGMTPRHGTFEDIDDEALRDTFDAFVVCFAVLVREVVGDMKARRWGRIVTIGSRSVKQPLRAHEVPYVLANTVRIAAVGLSKTLAGELGPYGITVNTAATGRFETPANRASVSEIAGASGGDAYITERLRHIPLRRLGRPEEMAALVTFLCSENGGYVTGETICCDGGRNESML